MPGGRCQSTCSPQIAVDADVAEVAAQRGHQAIAIVLVVRADAKQVGSVAAAVHEVGERRLLQPGVAAVEQGFLGANGVGNMFGDNHVAQPQPGAERFGKSSDVERAIGRQRGQRRKMRALVADIAIIIVLDDVAAVSPRPFDHLGAPLRRQRRTRRILMRGSGVEQRRGASRQIIRNQSIPVDGDAGDFAARGFERQSGALIAGILDYAERAAGEKEPCRERKPFLDSGHDHDAAGIGHDTACGRQMIGDRGAQRRQSRRLAILGKPRTATVRKIILQEAAPGLQRKQIRAGASRKEIVEQPVAAGMGWRVRARVTQRQRHPRARREIARFGGRPDRRGIARQCFGDINPRCRPQLDDPLHQQQVVGAHDGVSGNRQLLR